MTDKYILEGHEPVPCEDIYEWGRWFQGNRHVDKTDIGMPIWKYWLGKFLRIKAFEPISVSTVFLGLDRNFDSGPPILFETMVFGGSLDGQMERYSTWGEAEVGHKRWVEKVKRQGQCKVE